MDVLCIIQCIFVSKNSYLEQIVPQLLRFRLVHQACNLQLPLPLLQHTSHPSHGFQNSENFCMFYSLLVFRIQLQFFFLLFETPRLCSFFDPLQLCKLSRLKKTQGAAAKLSEKIYDFEFNFGQRKQTWPMKFVNFSWRTAPLPRVENFFFDSFTLMMI